MKRQTTAEETYYRLTTDFPYFLRALWAETGLDKKSPLDPLHLDMAKWIDNREQRTRGVLATRGVGKTTIGTSAYSCYRLLGDPELRIMVASEAQTHARWIIKQIRDWIRIIPWLQHLEPSVDRNCTDNADAFDVGMLQAITKNPSVRSAGITGQITGTRAGLLIADDIETSRSADTPNSREKIAEAVREFRSICSFGNREILYLGTPHHRECLYDKLMARGDERTRYAFRVYPIMLPKREWRHPEIAPVIQDMLEEHGEVGNEIVPLFPSTLDEELIHERMAEGLVEFTRQQMCVSDAEDMEYPLRLSDLIVPTVSVDMHKAPVWIKHGLRTGHNESTAWDDIHLLVGGNDRLHREIGYANEWDSYSSTLGFVDPSGRGADETAWAIGGYLAGYIWTKKLGHSGLGEPGDSPMVMARIAHDAREARCHRIVVESQFGGGSYAQLLEVEIRKLSLRPGEDANYPDGWTCHVETVPAKGRKEQRIINALSPVMHAHRLVVPREFLEPERDVASKYQLQYQLANITDAPGCLLHDDRAEALAGMVSLFSEQLDVSPENMAEIIAQRELDELAEQQHEALSRLYPGLYEEIEKPNWISK